MHVKAEREAVAGCDAVAVGHLDAHSGRGAGARAGDGGAVGAGDSEAVQIADDGRVRVHRICPAPHVAGSHPLGQDPGTSVHASVWRRLKQMRELTAHVEV